jgi:hypothetical protein
MGNCRPEKICCDTNTTHVPPLFSLFRLRGVLYVFIIQRKENSSSSILLKKTKTWKTPDCGNSPWGLCSNSRTIAFMNKFPRLLRLYSYTCLRQVIPSSGKTTLSLKNGCALRERDTHILFSLFFRTIFLHP